MLRYKDSGEFIQPGAKIKIPRGKSSITEGEYLCTTREYGCFQIWGTGWTVRPSGEVLIPGRGFMFYKANQDYEVIEVRD